MTRTRHPHAARALAMSSDQTRPGDRRQLLARSVAVALLAATSAGLALAQGAGEPVKIGLVLPMTGPFASTGKQIEAAAKLWLAQNGNNMAGRKVELILKDDGGVADTTRRLAQELVVNDKVTALAGFGLTPLALAAAPIATQGKTPQVVMAAATSSITEASPYIVRTSFTLPTAAVAMADWAAKNKVKRVVSLVADYGPGIDAEKWFADRFAAGGGTVIDKLRTPLRSPDFSPVLQKTRDEKPDAVFVFLPSGQGTAFMKQFAERGLDKAGVKLIGTGDVTDDDLLADMGDVALGVVTAHHYSAAHSSAVNKKFVEAFQAANNKMRPNFMAVGGYDGMQLIAKGLEASKGQGGEALLEAMKKQSFESPRGPVSIDPATREIVQNMYVRKVEKMNGALFNVEFDTLAQMKDPAKK